MFRELRSGLRASCTQTEEWGARGRKTEDRRRRKIEIWKQNGQHILQQQQPGCALLHPNLSPLRCEKLLACCHLNKAGTRQPPFDARHVKHEHSLIVKRRSAECHACPIRPPALATFLPCKLPANSTLRFRRPWMIFLLHLFNGGGDGA